MEYHSDLMYRGKALKKRSAMYMAFVSIIVVLVALVIYWVAKQIEHSYKVEIDKESIHLALQRHAEEKGWKQ
jgi:CHASE3 domain sensor protein